MLARADLVLGATPWPGQLRGTAPIVLSLSPYADGFLPLAEQIIAAAAEPVDPVARYWINAAVFNLINRGALYMEIATAVSNLSRYIANGYVLWSTLGVSPGNADNTSALDNLPSGVLVIGDTPGIINFSGLVAWGAQTWLVLDPSMQLVCSNSGINANVITGRGNDISVFGLNLTLQVPSQGVNFSNVSNLNIQTASFTRASDMTTYGILQTIVNDHVADISIPANMPDLLTVYDPTQSSGRYARRYLPDFTLNQATTNTQAAWSFPLAAGPIPNPPTNIGPRLWQVPVKHSISSKGWVVGDILGLKSKHGGVSVLRVSFCTNVLVGGVSMHESSRCVFTDCTNLILTGWNILRPPDEILTTNEGGPQCVGCTNVLVDTYVAQNPGDDALAFFSYQPPPDPVLGPLPPIPSTGFVRNVKVNDGFGRGILLWTTPNVAIDQSCVIVNCPILEHATVNLATTAYVTRMTVPPDFDRQVIIDNFVVAIRDAAHNGNSATDIFSKLDWLLLLKSHDSQAALIDLIFPNHNAVISGGATWNIDQSFSGNGSNAAINTNFFGTPNYTQNSACMFAYNINSIINENKPMCGGQTTAPATTVAEIVPFNNGNMLTQANDATADSDAVTTSPSGFYLWNRTDANTKSVYKDGVLLSTHTTASTAIPAQIQALATGAVFSTAQLAVFGYGAALLPAEIATLNTAVMAFVTAF
jgi:hypothetical protein